MRLREYVQDYSQFITDVKNNLARINDNQTRYRKLQKNHIPAIFDLLSDKTIAFI